MTIRQTTTTIAAILMLASPAMAQQRSLGPSTGSVRLEQVQAGPALDVGQVELSAELSANHAREGAASHEHEQPQAEHEAASVVTPVSEALKHVGGSQNRRRLARRCQEGLQFRRCTEASNLKGRLPSTRAPK